jgi:very-short-patch-repair endonuclease
MARKFDRSLGGKWEEIYARAERNFRDLISDFGIPTVCESEIEGMLALVFHANSCLGNYNETDFTWRTNGWWGDGGLDFDSMRVEGQGENELWVAPQVRVGDYRVDFLCTMNMHHYRENRNASLVLAIECDGHEFHEKTKEQAARDKSRDRTLLLRGIPSMRFAGSEIWRSPYGCMKQIDVFFRKRFCEFIGIDPIYPPEAFE